MRYMQKEILAIGTQIGCPKLNLGELLFYRTLVGSFLIPRRAGVIHKATPITKNTLLNA
jgi:hypothetical protein